MDSWVCGKDIFIWVAFLDIKDEVWNREVGGCGGIYNTICMLLGVGGM